MLLFVVTAGLEPAVSGDRREGQMVEPNPALARRRSKHKRDTFSSRVLDAPPRVL
jgi:hypothetical protein